MPRADPFKFQGLWRRFDTMYAATKRSDKQPLRGVTQGKSSGKNAGAKPAAVNSDIYRGTQKDITDGETR